MLTTLEKEQIEALAQQIDKLSSELDTHKMVISGLLKMLFDDKSTNHSEFFKVIQLELNKLTSGSDKKHQYSYTIQNWVDKYRD